MESVRTEAEQQMTLQANTHTAMQSMAVFDAVMEETGRPMELQWAFLKELLEDNRDTEYGKEYHFSEIRSIEDYQKNVPVASWANFDPYVERMIAGEKNVLTAYEFDHFNMSSGTSGKPKHLAYTEKHKNAYVKYNSLCSYGLLAKEAGLDWCRGRAFSPNTGLIRTLPTGVTEGPVCAKIVEYVGGADADRTMRTMFTSPLEATAAAPGKDTNYIHCRFALEERNVTGINVMYLPFLLTILKYMDGHLELLIHDIETGEINPSIELPEECRASLLTKIRPLPERAAELKEIFKNGHDFQYLPVIWPNLKYIFGCSGGGFTNYDRTMRNKYTGEGLTRIYYGITATEGIFSMPFKADSIESVLLPGALFMEFLPVENGGDLSGIVTMDKVETGREYELVITNAAGLYRYRMSDTVRITGWLNGTPTVQFVGRANKTINMAAEKTSETCVEQAMEEAAGELNASIFDFCVYPDYENQRYQFLIEPSAGSTLDTEKFAGCLEKIMERKNEAYGATVALKRLNPLGVSCLQQGTCLLYREIMEFKGAAASTIKPVHIITTDFQKAFFVKLAED